MSEKKTYKYEDTELYMSIPGANTYRIQDDKAFEMIELSIAKLLAMAYGYAGMGSGVNNATVVEMMANSVEKEVYPAIHSARTNHTKFDDESIRAVFLGYITDRRDFLYRTGLEALVSLANAYTLSAPGNELEVELNDPVCDKFFGENWREKYNAEILLEKEVSDEQI